MKCLPKFKPDRKKIEKLLDKAWSDYVRSRDKTCKKCGGSGIVSAHHAFGRRHQATRWDIYNGVGLCYPCHIHWAHRDPCGFSEWFRDHVGEYQFDRLSECHNDICKFTTDELLEMLDFFNEKEIR